jgi:hypothetical protein
LADWLRHGRSDDRDFPNCLPPWLFGFPPLEEWLALLEKRLLAKLSRAEERTPKPGTKEAVLKHFGIFKDDADLEAQLAQIMIVLDTDIVTLLSYGKTASLQERIAATAEE